MVVRAGVVLGSAVVVVVVVRRSCFVGALSSFVEDGPTIAPISNSRRSHCLTISDRCFKFIIALTHDNEANSRVLNRLIGQFFYKTGRLKFRKLCG